MNLSVQDILVYIIVLLCVWRVVRHFYRIFSCRHGGCCESGGCAGCALGQQCRHHKKKTVDGDEE